MNGWMMNERSLFFGYCISIHLIFVHMILKKNLFNPEGDPTRFILLDSDSSTVRQSVKSSAKITIYYFLISSRFSLIPCPKENSKANVKSYKRRNPLRLIKSYVRGSFSYIYTHIPFHLLPKPYIHKLVCMS